MLPCSDYRPPGLAKCCIDFRVASPVPGDLLFPILAVSGRKTIVIGAAMPVAAVNKDSDALAEEDDISRPPNVWQWAGRHTIPQASLVKLRSEPNLGLGIAAPVALH